MSDVIVMSDGDVRTKPLSLEEMRAEWRAAQDEMIQMHAEMAQIADALWPDEHSERPADLDAEGATGAQLVAGIRSLQELSDRQAAEIERWRQRHADVEEQLQSAIEQARDDAGPELTALDRADIRAELTERVAHCERLASDCEHSLPDYARQSAASWRARAQRIRQLISFLRVP